MKTPKSFQRVALIGRQRGENIIEALLGLKNYLRSLQVNVVFEQETALLNEQFKPAIPSSELAQHADLIIVVGGDGSLLKAGRIAANQHLPVLGINRGRLGFLTDIHPEEYSKVGQVIAGEYITESRFLLSANCYQQQQLISSQDALNDVVLLPGRTAHMIEFAIYINHQFVCNQRADGLIVATPTGSTAYALSGGGPILQPNLNAMVLVPMFPHTLSNRPIVIPNDCTIKLVISEDNEVSPFVSADGQERIPIAPGGKIEIYKKEQELCLIHPRDYNYYETLRVKLGWVSK